MQYTIHCMECLIKAQKAQCVGFKLISSCKNRAQMHRKKKRLNGFYVLVLCETQLQNFTLAYVSHNLYVKAQTGLGQGKQKTLIQPLPMIKIEEIFLRIVA